MTFRGAVVGCEPGSAGPRGRARWRKESASTIFVRYSGKSKYRATAYMRLVLCGKSLGITSAHLPSPLACRNLR